MRKLANIISILFHPLLMTTMVVVTLYFFAPSILLPVREDSIHQLLIIVLMLTYILPLLSVGMLRLTGSITSMALEDRKERIRPFFFITVYYGLTTYFFAEKLVLSDAMIVLFASITTTVLLVTVISTFFKISAHTAGTAGVLAFLIVFHFKDIGGVLIWPIVVALVLHGVVSSARLYLNTHNPGEVHLGALLGFTVNFCGAYFFT